MDDTIRSLAVAEDPLPALQGLHAVMRAAYWERKDLTEVLALAKAGIEHGEPRAAAAPTDEKAEILGWVKTIAYDAGSFTWPGWDEDGIEIDDEARAYGLDAARLNLRLAIQLERPDEVVSTAHWLLGAQLLANGDHEEAIGAFTDAQVAATKANDQPNEMLARGYESIARIVGGQDARDAYEAVKAGFAALDDGVAYVAQLDTALKVFA